MQTRLNTFLSVSSMKVLASENQREQEDGQQAQGANQHSTQVHVYKGNMHQNSDLIQSKILGVFHKRHIGDVAQVA